MRKYLPFALPILGILILLGGFLYIRGRQDVNPSQEDEETLIQVPLEERPVAALTPTADGHTLTLLISKLEIEAASLDYELLYELSDGRTQGVPGSIDITGQESIERELLLGSESSGKKRYDEGVEKGTLTLRFRNDKGKLIAKFATDFHLQSKTKALSTVDGKFTYTLDKVPTAGFFVTMDTFGVPEMPTGTVSDGPYGVFGSTKTGLPGKVNLSGNVQRWTGSKWESLIDSKASNVGIFISSN